MFEEQTTRQVPPDDAYLARDGLTGSGALQLVQAVTENPTVAGVATGVAAAKAMQLFSNQKDSDPAPPPEPPPSTPKE